MPQVIRKFISVISFVHGSIDIGLHKCYNNLGNSHNGEIYGYRGVL